MTTPDHSADNGTNIISKSLAEQIRVTVPISWAQKSESESAPAEMGEFSFCSKKQS